MVLEKRTPCIGICSTTYGDLVCRGCKRFAHEIVQWNGYDREQQEQIWQRLRDLRNTVVLQYLCVAHVPVFNEACSAAGIPLQIPADAVYALARKLASDNRSLGSAGLTLARAPESTNQARLQDTVSQWTEHSENDAMSALQMIDVEVYARSVAHYERNYKISL